MSKAWISMGWACALAWWGWAGMGAAQEAAVEEDAAAEAPPSEATEDAAASAPTATDGLAKSENEAKPAEPGNFLASGGPYTVVIKYAANVNNRKVDGTAYGFVVDEGRKVVASSLIFKSSVTDKNLKKVTCRRPGEDQEWPLVFDRREDDLALVTFRFKKTPDPAPAALAAFPDRQARVGDEGFLFIESSKEYGYAPMFCAFRATGAVTKPIRGRLISRKDLAGAVGSLVYDAQGKPVGYLGGKTTRTVRRIGNRILRQEKLNYTVLYPLSNVDKLLNPSDRKEGWSGLFNLQYLDDDLRKLLEVEAETGILVARIVPDSPAEKAGVQVEDVIVGQDGEPLDLERDTDLPRWRDVLHETGAGKKVTLDLLRKGADGWEEVEATLTLVEKPPTSKEAKKTKIKKLGLEVCEITWDVILQHRLEPGDEKGVYVTDVEKGSPAELAGLSKQVILYQLGQTPLTSVKDLQKAVKALEKEKPEEVQVIARKGFKRNVGQIPLSW